MQKHPRQRKCVISEGEVVFTAWRLTSVPKTTEDGFCFNIFLSLRSFNLREHHRENVGVVTLHWLYGGIQIQRYCGAGRHLLWSVRDCVITLLVLFIELEFIQNIWFCFSFVFLIPRTCFVVTQEKHKRALRGPRLGRGPGKGKKWGARACQRWPCK